MKPGIELLLETLDFAEKIKDADLIITGEGKSDRQTLMGKVPSGILQEARRQHIPVILLAGAIEDAGILNAAGFRGVFSITPSPVSLEQAMQPKLLKKISEGTVEQNLPNFLLTPSNSFNIPIAPDTDHVSNQPADGMDHQMPVTPISGIEASQ